VTWKSCAAGSITVFDPEAWDHCVPWSKCTAAAEGGARVADLMLLGGFHFCSAFRNATGRQLLADPAIRITDANVRVSYQTPSAFTARFRRHIGDPPTEFRRQFSPTSEARYGRAP